MALFKSKWNSNHFLILCSYLRWIDISQFNISEFYFIHLSIILFIFFCYYYFLKTRSSYVRAMWQGMTEDGSETTLSFLLFSPDCWENAKSLTLIPVLDQYVIHWRWKIYFPPWIPTFYLFFWCSLHSLIWGSHAVADRFPPDHSIFLSYHQWAKQGSDILSLLHPPRREGFIPQ